MCCSITYEIRTCWWFSRDWLTDRSPNLKGQATTFHILLHTNLQQTKLSNTTPHFLFSLLTSTMLSSHCHKTSYLTLPCHLCNCASPLPCTFPSTVLHTANVFSPSKQCLYQFLSNLQSPRLTFYIANLMLSCSLPWSSPYHQQCTGYNHYTNRTTVCITAMLTTTANKWTDRKSILCVCITEALDVVKHKPSQRDDHKNNEWNRDK